MAAVAAAALSAVGSFVNTGMQFVQNEGNIAAQREINEKNIEAQKYINMKNNAMQREINLQNLDYAKAQTQAQWERDDNAHQREVNDLISAGLSPLANLSGSTNSAVVDYQGQAPHEDPLPEAKAYLGQAPQFDINSIMQSYLQASELTEKMREFDKKAIQEDRSLDIEAQRVGFLAKQLDIENSKVDLEMLKTANNYQLMSEQIVQSKMELEENKRQFNAEYAYKQNEFVYKALSENSMRTVNAMAEAHKQGHINVLPCYSYNDFERAMKNYGKKLGNFLASKGLNKFDEIKAHFGTGIHSGSEGQGIGASIGYKPNSKREEILLRQFEATTPFPIFIYGSMNLDNLSKNINVVKK